MKLRRAGSIAEGVPADLVVFKPLATCPFDTLMAATRTDVRLTMIDGQPRVGETSMATVFRAAGVEASDATLDGAPWLVAGWIGRQLSKMTLGEPGFEVQ